MPSSTTVSTAFEERVMAIRRRRRRRNQMGFLI
jgi:hypothetical protein